MSGAHFGARLIADTGKTGLCFSPKILCSSRTPHGVPLVSANGVLNLQHLVPLGQRGSIQTAKCDRGIVHTKLPP